MECLTIVSFTQDYIYIYIYIYSLFTNQMAVQQQQINQNKYIMMHFAGIVCLCSEWYNKEQASGGDDASGGQKVLRCKNQLPWTSPQGIGFAVTTSAHHTWSVLC